MQPIERRRDLRNDGGELIILSRFPVAFRPPALASWSSCSR